MRSAGRLPLPLLAAARSAARGTGRGDSPEPGLRVDTRCRQPSLLRFGRNLLHTAVSNLQTTSCQQTGSAAGRHTGGHRNRQHRLPAAPRDTGKSTRQTLDRAGGRGDEW